MVAEKIASRSRCPPASGLGDRNGRWWRSAPPNISSSRPPGRAATDGFRSTRRRLNITVRRTSRGGTMAKGGLWYPCSVCGKDVRHEPNPGDHVLDDGTTLFCPECGGATEVHFVVSPGNTVRLTSLPPDGPAGGIVDGISIAGGAAGEANRLALRPLFSWQTKPQTYYNNRIMPRTLTARNRRSGSLCSGPGVRRPRRRLLDSKTNSPIYGRKRSADG